MSSRKQSWHPPTYRVLQWGKNTMRNIRLSSGLLGVFVFKKNIPLATVFYLCTGRNVPQRHVWTRLTRSVKWYSWKILPAGVGDGTGWGSKDPWRSPEDCCLKNGPEESQSLQPNALFGRSGSSLYFKSLSISVPPRMWLGTGVRKVFFASHDAWEEQHCSPKSPAWRLLSPQSEEQLSNWNQLSRVTQTSNCAPLASASPASLCRHYVEQHVHDSENANVCSQAHRLLFFHCPRHVMRGLSLQHIEG